MLPPRVIPALLLKNAGLVKTVRFDKSKYIGDPINAVRIFNDKEVDELTFLDISASQEGRGPNFSLIKRIAGEAFMPFGYGGGIMNIDQIKQLFALGVEKVVLNTAAFHQPELVSEAASLAGSSSVVVSVDVRHKLLRGARCYVKSGSVDTKEAPAAYAARMEELGAGEVLLTSIDREGTMSGYDTDLIRKVSQSIQIPVVALGGASGIGDLAAAIEAGASAVAAGSMFVFHGRRRAVLITYPEYQLLREALV
jgi:imidazole glycerol-phosphate synthase subunit HisF